MRTVKSAINFICKGSILLSEEIGVPLGGLERILRDAHDRVSRNSAFSETKSTECTRTSRRAARDRTLGILIASKAKDSSFCGRDTCSSDEDSIRG